MIGVNTGSFSGTHDGLSFAISVAEVKQNLPSLASGVDVLVEPTREWWTYENDELMYSLLVHPNWNLAEEKPDGTVYFVRYEGDNLVGSISIRSLEMDQGQTLLDVAESWFAALTETARTWDTFQLYSDEPELVGHGYSITYMWSKGPNIHIDRDVIFESSYYFDIALVYSVHSYDEVRQAVLQEIAEMKFTY